MNPLILIFADGTAFFIGLAVSVAAVMGVRFWTRGWVRAVLKMAVIGGMIFVLVSATPLPIWAYSLWTVSMVAALTIFGRRGISRMVESVVSVMVVAVSAGLFMAEIRYRRFPDFVVPESATVYVLGDSISAGMGTEHVPWPAVLDRAGPYTIVNLAMAGATVESAFGQAGRIAEDGSYVVVEIGGNELLGGTDAVKFAAGLEALLSALQANGHRVLLFELPLFPFQNGYGEAQRDLAAKYGAALLPKRYFAKVLGMKDGTLDGLHLSQQGHDALAEMIAEVLRGRR